ncbi:MAG TPA: 2-C-methyl-D-erythritol 2,4-cyclodiphosphate synthase [Victivallales bacterium]|nr:2-C-methyl-D-erythritol 2,4-cyclodiphosphate synthase [Victivallales bacterium]
MDIRIGQGFDAHKFIKNRPLILGGISIPYEFGLDGHSDADVLTHAVIDSLLGALSMGNIGTWFPDNDLKYKNADSIQLLEKVISSKELKSWELINLDGTIIAQKPKLLTYLHPIQKKLATVLKTDADNISIKPKTTEGMGFCGRKEGIAVLVNILLCKIEQ